MDDRAIVVAGALGSIAVIGLAALVLAIATRDPGEAGIEGVSAAAAADAGAIAADVGELDAGLALAAPVLPDAGPYALDGIERTPELIAEGCPEVPLVDRAGPWRPALRIHPAFVPTAEDVERAFTEAAIARYGRAPLALLSATSYRCRSIRGRPERPSEHALGNALDVRGVVIAADGGELEITVREHWGTGSIHDLFLHDAARRIVERARARGIIGPPTADHLDHFHIDHGPSRFVAISLE